jgi:hypothetical protein
VHPSRFHRLASSPYHDAARSSCLQTFGNPVNVLCISYRFPRAMLGDHFPNIASRISEFASLPAVPPSIAPTTLTGAISTIALVVYICYQSSDFSVLGITGLAQVYTRLSQLFSDRGSKHLTYHNHKRFQGICLYLRSKLSPITRFSYANITFMGG